MHMRAKQRNWLAELRVVVVVGAISWVLLTFVVPAYFQILDQGKIQSVRIEVDELARAARMYAYDNHGKFPRSLYQKIKRQGKAQAWYLKYLGSDDPLPNMYGLDVDEPSNQRHAGGIAYRSFGNGDSCTVVGYGGKRDSVYTRTCR